VVRKKVLKKIKRSGSVARFSMEMRTFAA